MSLTFKNEDLKGLLIHARAQWPLGLRPLHGDEPTRGFWIVGDDGVYLMHNGKAHEGMERQPAVYAVGCSPDDADWYEVKHAEFGGDDGVDFIEPNMIERVVETGDDLKITFTEDSMTLIGVPAKNEQGNQQ